MKKKLTLSIDEAIVRKAKALGRRTGKSVSEFFEEAVEMASAEAKPVRKRWSEEWGGSLDLSKADADRDDRFGKLVRSAKTKAGQRAKKRA